MCSLAGRGRRRGRERRRSERDAGCASLSGGAAREDALHGRVGRKACSGGARRCARRAGSVRTRLCLEIPGERGVVNRYRCAWADRSAGGAGALAAWSDVGECVAPTSQSGLAVVGASAWEYAGDLDVAVFDEAEDDAPVADAQSPAVAAGEAADAERGIGSCEALDRVEDAPADRRVEAAQVAFGARRKRDAPFGSLTRALGADRRARCRGRRRARRTPAGWRQPRQQ